MFSSMSLSTAATRPKSAEDVCIPAAGDNVEVNCERFFSLAGYVSRPARSRMKSSTYERLAILPAIMDVLYIDEDAVVDEGHYLRNYTGEEDHWTSMPLKRLDRQGRPTTRLTTNSFIYVAASADELNSLFETKPTYIITNVILMIAIPNSYTSHTCMHL